MAYEYDALTDAQAKQVADIQQKKQSLISERDKLNASKNDTIRTVDIQINTINDLIAQCDIDLAAVRSPKK